MSELMIRLYVAMTVPRDDRGDVPGWVMVTLMTAIVVAALTPFVGDELRNLLVQAFSMVSG